MSNLAKLEFVALDISGNNYLSCVLDAKIHLDAKGLGDTIKDGNGASTQDKAKAMIFLRHHLHEGLKAEYLTVKDPLDLWKNLNDMYDHQKTVILPAARYEWLHLRLQDYKTVIEYNSAMFRITSQLKLCGDNITDADMLEKTYSTFHPSNNVLSQQYREKGFKKYSKLISSLLLVEKNNELLLKNHQSRPTRSAPTLFPEVNAIARDKKYQRNVRGYASSRGQGRVYGRGGYRGGRGGYNSRFKQTYVHQKWQNDNKRENDKITENLCYRCRGRNHLSCTCRTPKHLVELYQQSIKNKNKQIETNFVFGDGNGDGDINCDKSGTSTHLETSDFFDSLTAEED